jgi:N-acetylneuraminic acid mutarotase
VWTGSEMIVWGGNGLNTGGRYNPSTDSWIATNTANAPSGRTGHTAVWTGIEMIVWGGNFSNTGGRYDPVADSWTATNTTNAPTGRSDHRAVWSDSEMVMIVWGGDNGSPLNTGGRYNPITDSWMPTSLINAPSARLAHAAVWADSAMKMIVWGGADDVSYLNTGGRYDPVADSWTPTSTINAPPARRGPMQYAVWTGSEMIVWGGYNGGGSGMNTGGRYNPITDSWMPTSLINAPSVRFLHTVVWADGEMIVWGGSGPVNTGGRYCVAALVPFTLSAAKRKVGGINTVRLTWSGATSTTIDVYRDGMPIVTTANDGSYVDSTGDTGRARYTYRVCEAGTFTCSNNARVTFRQ